MSLGDGWVVDVDLRRFFETIDHGHLREMLRRRVRDGVILRLIGKWLAAGVLEAGVIMTPEQGTPQGGVISPLLANIVLHYVLDEWFARVVRPRLKGRAFLIRYADDFLIGVTREDDARRIMDVLPKRMSKYGLEVHPGKTRLVRFAPADASEPGSEGSDARPPTTFDFLGFTHFWGRSRRGEPVVKRQTARSRLRRTLGALSAWCRANLHLPIRDQHRKLCQKLQGHYGYFGIIGNSARLGTVRFRTRQIWRRWLSRRRRGGPLSWAAFVRPESRYMLPPARVVHGLASRGASS